MTAIETLEALRPRTKTNVMTLLEQAKHDVSYWERDANDLPVRTAPAANPAYCYDWSFGSPSEGVVLCIWFASLSVDADQIIYGENMRALAEGLDRVAADRTRTPNDKNRARQQAARARHFDGLVKEAFDKLLPVRLIINEGNQADREKLGAGSSEVSFRAMDADVWYVHRYNEKSGQCLIVRAIVPGRDLDDAGEAMDDGLGPPDERQLAAIRVRRGQRDFRERLLSAWGRRCVVTSCRLVELLEAAHITPHAEVADYRTSNGLLLRADIHTLFDLGLLSIDEHMRVHLTDELLASEYKDFAGKCIDRRPDKSVDAPSVAALRRRHQEFVKRRCRT
jgi:hypothetical protein